MRITKTHPNAKVPTKAHPNDAAFDLYADETYLLFPNEPVKIHTGIKIELPPHYQGFIWDRSSLGSKGIKTLGGVIDNGYRGEIIVCLVNVSKNSYNILKGDKVAQLTLVRTGDCNIEVVDSLEDTDRGSKGFGSSGR